MKKQKVRLATAEICYQFGKAIIYNPDNKVYIIEKNRDSSKIELKDGAGVHPGMFFQSGEVTTVNAGTYPFTRLHNQLKMSAKIHEAIDFFLMMLDPEFSAELRKESEELFEEELAADKKISARVRKFILEIPLPKEFDINLGPTKGRVGRLLNKLRKKVKLS